MAKKKLAMITIFVMGFLVVFLSVNYPAFAKERVVEFDNPGCE